MPSSVAQALSAKLFFLLSLFSLSFGSVAEAAEWWEVEIGGLVIQAEVVRTDKDQQRGLGNRFFLKEDKGMLFYYPTPGTRIFWMKNMHFPIDILWIQNRRIVKIEHDVQPPLPNTPNNRLKQYGFGVSADKVLEVQAGFAKRHHLQVGDTLRFNQNH